MPAHKAILDDYAVASIAAYVKKRFNKENIAITSEKVSKIRAAAEIKK